ncbi:hypothetical protein [Actinomadura sp. SCN-SB]|uniref:hypothetical protein n=1 Tax=Actinomadura sp. SCN-SB TaxID=3373092 RepID=UPI003753B54E
MATVVPTTDKETGGAVPAQGPRPRATGDHDMTLLGHDLFRGRIPESEEGLAQRVRVLRRARRDARTRSARVRRVLLAPTSAPVQYNVTAAQYTTRHVR